MSTNGTRRPLTDHLATSYRFNVIAGDPDEGGYVVEFPDLPGCMTSIETLDELVPTANEIRELWIETAYELGDDIPEPTYPLGTSGRFVTARELPHASGHPREPALRTA